MNKQFACVLFVTGACIGMPGYYPFFYTPGPFFGEPRLQESRMTSFEVRLDGGHAHHGFNAHHSCVNVLGIYGDENFHALVQGVPASCLPVACGTFLSEIAHEQPAQDNFGKISFTGYASVIDCLFGITQNLKRGFFLSFCLPVRCNEIKSVRFVDHTTQSSCGPHIDYIQWQNFANHLDEHLACYGVDAGQQRCHGIGDVQVWGGWTLNYENTSYIDYVDLTIAAGVSCPTAPRICLADIFVLPLGYDGHVGVPLYASASLGVWDWLTVGLNSAGILFVPKTRPVALTTDSAQSGWIRLARVPARVRRAGVWHIDGYVKADHVIDGLSLLFDFGHDHAGKTCMTPCNNDLHSYTDARNWGWSMTTFHLVIDYDAATFARPYLPHGSFTVDTAIKGRHALKTTLFGAVVGCDLSWKF